MIKRKYVKEKGEESQIERKRESEMGLKPGLPKNYSNEGTQIRKCGPLKCKGTKCHKR